MAGITDCAAPPHAATRFWCVMTTPLGMPVEPEVYLKDERERESRERQRETDRQTERESRETKQKGRVTDECAQEIRFKHTYSFAYRTRQHAHSYEHWTSIDCIQQENTL